KMSKSKGEFLTLSLLESKGYSPMEYRFFCLGSHYRKSLVFTYENLENAASAYRKLVAKIALLAPSAGESFDEVGAEPLRRAFRDALDNDLNTSLAVTVLYDVLKAPVNDTTKEKLLSEFDTVLALGLLSEAEKLRQEKETAPASAGDLSAVEIEAMIAARADAKKQKNYAEADRIRAELLSHGVVLTDTPTGTTYRVQ
ncbi:MAG: DALR domain-containing protein, partial [Eubacteriales bacterium]